jgi:hypothetical protein
MYHFVREDVVFDDGNKSGNFKTNRSYKNEEGVNTYATMLINNNYHNLTITDVSQQTIPLDHAKANILVRKGVCHKIDTVLKYYE